VRIYVNAVLYILGLRYWLDIGALLGSIRDGGILPWDDDEDVGRLKSEFEAFRTAIRKEVASNSDRSNSS
jgi:lipopolysaccharide cholinephosphotransferase